jgi:hypothetical protein
MGFVKKHTGVDVAAPVKFVQSGISSIGNATGISPALTKVFQPIEKAVVQPVGQGLAGLDKMVGNAIPGGWGTLASMAGSAVGLPTPALMGLGALTGSGVMRKGGNFNLQGALIGGATAYASAKMGDYLRSAAPGAGGISELTPPPTVDAAGNLINQATGQVGSGLAGNASGLLPPPPPPSVFSQVMSGNFGDAISQAGTNIGSAASSAGKSLINAPSDVVKAVSNFDYSGAIDKGLSNASQTGAGIKNLVMGPAGVSKTASALSGVNPVTMGGAALYGTASLSDLDAQRNFLKEQQAAGNIAQAEYDAALAEINRQAGIASESVAGSPFSTNPNRDVSIGETYYGRNNAEDTLYGRGGSSATLYAMGGSVDDELGADEARSLGLGNLSNGLMNMGSTPAYAAGGQPRFLSGGGDGMSDSIKASINGTQEARLADGEFVIPADVVSHLGNGSSKAGAKRLYSMMDKVRVARTGTKQQGKQINPRKYLGV